MNSIIIYSKTPKGFRQHKSLFGGLSSLLLKVLKLVDGKSSAEKILNQLDGITKTELDSILAELLKEGCIKEIVPHGSKDWIEDVSFSPMIVEEVSFDEEPEGKTEKATPLKVDKVVQSAANLPLADEFKVNGDVEQKRIQEIEKAEAEENTRREVVRIAYETKEALKKIEVEARANAEEKARLEVERKENLEARALFKEELNARLEAEKARIRADAEESARRGVELRGVERLARDAEETLKKAKAEALANAEERARLEAERKENLEARAHLKEKMQAQDEAEKKLIKAEVEAKEKALRELERLAREAGARVIAEVQARLEAERKAKVEEQARLKSEFKAKSLAEEIRVEEARLESMRIAQETEEARGKSEAEAFKVQYDAEKNRIKAESEAKDSALKEMERLAREAEATTIVVEQARLEAERKAESGEKARLESERKAQELSELISSREKAHREMVHIAQEAEEARKKSADEARRAQVETEKIRTKMQLEAERVVLENAKAQIKTKSVDASGKEITQTTAKDETDALATQKVTQQEESQYKKHTKVSALHKISVRIVNSYFWKWFPKVTKVALIYLPIFVVLMIGVLQFVNLSMFILPIDKLASESLDEPVTVNEVHVSLWPQPMLVLGKVAVGGDAGIKITAVNIYPIYSTLFEKVKVVKSIEITGMQIAQENFWHPLQWIRNAGRVEHLKIEQVNFKNLELNISDLKLSTFDGKVELGESREFIGLDMNSIDDLLHVQIKPQGGRFNVALTGTNWPLPVNPKIVFEEIKARGMFNYNSLDFSQIEGRIYNGNITAKATINWSKQWVSTGEFKFSGVNSEHLLKAFGAENYIEGKLIFAGVFACKSDEAAKLTDDANVSGDFEISNGKIQNLDLARALLSQGAGYSTNFDKLTGSIQAQAGLFHYRKLLLQSNQLQAKATLDIQPNQDVSGSVSTNLVAQSRRLQAKFELAGKVDDVKFK
jgi:hypothetical protein